MKLIATAACALALAAPAAAEIIFVTDESAHCVHVIDGAALKETGCIAVGERPRGIVRSKDGRTIYVAVSDANDIAVIDVASRAVVRRLKSGPDPETFALTPDEKHIYIANEDDNLVSVIDTTTNSIVREIAVGGEPEGTAVSPDGRIAVQASESASMAHVIDTATGKVLANLIVDTRPRYIAFTPDGSRFWVSSEARGSVTVFDAASLKQAGKVDFEAAGLTKEPIQAVGTRFTRDGKRAFVALGRGKLVAEVDPARLTIFRTWPVGLRAWNLALSPDERRIYTADGLDGTVSIIDLVSGKSLPPIRVGGKPWGVEVVP